MPGDPNVIGAFCYAVPCDAALETSPTISELTLAGCPVGLGYQLEVTFIGFRCNTLPVDGSNNVHVDIEHIDDSNSDTVTDLKTDYDLEAATVKVVNKVWEGRQILDPGDALNAEFDVTTPDTASEGAAFIVAGRILKRS